MEYKVSLPHVQETVSVPTLSQINPVDIHRRYFSEIGTFQRDRGHQYPGSNTFRNSVE